MMMTTLMKKAALAAMAGFVAGALTLGLSGVSAAPAMADPVKARQEAMKTVGAGMKKLVAILKGEADFVGEDVAAVGKSMKASLAKAAGLFPAGSDKGDTRAKATIWSDNASFMAGMKAAEAAAQKVVAAGDDVDEDAFKAAFMQLGQTCKGCHEKFRKPKQ